VPLSNFVRGAIQIPHCDCVIIPVDLSYQFILMLRTLITTTTKHFYTSMRS